MTINLNHQLSRNRIILRYSFNFSTYPSICTFYSFEILSHMLHCRKKKQQAIMFIKLRFYIITWSICSVPCKQWFLQAGRYASMGKKPLRATVCFSIEHARPRDDYEYPTTRRQRELQQNNRFNKQNNNFARASRFYFCISLPFLHDYDVKMPNFAFYG